MTSTAIVSATIGALTSTALLVVVVIFLWWLDRYDREPLQLVAGAFLWGAAVAPLLAISSASMVTAIAGHALAGTLAVAAIEEFFKAVVVALVARYSADFDTPTDGLVYGTAAGLGFAAVENVIYTVGGAVTTADTGMLGLIVERTLFSAGVHGLASGVVGGFVGLGYLSRKPLSRIGWAACGLAIGTLLHGGWNAALSRAMAPGRQWPLFAAVPALTVLYVTAFVLFLRWEHRVLRLELEDEARLRLVPPWVPGVIPFYRRRIRSDWWPRREERTVLSRLLTRLAFRKFQTSRLPEAEASMASLEIVRLRSRVRCMLDPVDGSTDDEIVKPM